MWSLSSTVADDEEALLATSPTSTTSSNYERTTSPSPLWWRLLTLILTTFYRLILFALPSFLQRSHDAGSTKTFEKEATITAPKKFTTEYLDGVRGLASVIVFVFHWSHIHFPGVNSGYRIRKHSSIWQLPMIRFVYSGAAMVSIFFTVSGFVLTHRFIQKIHRREYTTLYPGLTSLTFRRALRLFLPSLASCVLAFICVSLGFVPIPQVEGHKPFQHGLLALFQYIDREFDPWTWDSYMKGFYNPQLWSISLEYRGSMVVFLVVLALARSRTIVRMAVESIIVVHAFGHKRWDVALFIAGMLIAEVEVLVHDSTSASNIAQRKSVKTVMIICMLIGVWLSGYPRDHADKSWGYRSLSRQWPHGGYRRRFWLGIGSILLVAPMSFLPRLQACFNTRLVRYFGKVSFALYLIHGLGNRMVGMWITRYAWQAFGTDEPAAYILSYLASTVIYVPIIFWWSDIFWRAFDVPSTQFAKWIEGECSSRTAS
jgi:peptidoglycan/LPS O-acetylase OafA/YrhL